MVEWFWCVSVAYTGEACALANNWFLLYMLVRIWTCAVDSCVWASNARTSTLKGVVWLWLVNDPFWGRVHWCAPMNKSCTVNPVMKAVHFALLLKNVSLIMTEQVAEVQNRRNWFPCDVKMSYLKIVKVRPRTASNAWTSTLTGVVWLWLVNDPLWGRVHGCAPMNGSCKTDSY